MKLSVFLAVLLPSVSAFVVPCIPPSIRVASNTVGKSTGALCSSNRELVWDVSQLWQDIVGGKSPTVASADPKPADATEEFRKKMEIKQERKCLEGQLCSLLRISGDALSPKVEEHVRFLTAQLERFQANANEFRKEGPGLAGRWKLIYSSAGTHKGSDTQGAVEEIAYVSENYRISHGDKGVLRVHKRMKHEDDTAHSSHVVGHGVGRGLRVKVAKRASESASGRSTRKHQPLRKRLFFGWRR